MVISYDKSTDHPIWADSKFKSIKKSIENIVHLRKISKIKDGSLLLMLAVSLDVCNVHWDNKEMKIS